MALRQIVIHGKHIRKNICIRNLKVPSQKKKTLDKKLLCVTNEERLLGLRYSVTLSASHRIDSFTWLLIPPKFEVRVFPVGTARN